MPAGMCDTSSAVADWREDSTRLSVAKMPSKRTTIIGSFQHLAIAMDRFINFIMFLETTIFIVHVMINHDEPWRRGRDSNPRGGGGPPPPPSTNHPPPPPPPPPPAGGAFFTTQ